jgi:hypothetical protein
MTRTHHLALFLVLALVLSACSGDGSQDSAGTDDTVASVSEDAPEKTDAAAADDSDSIRDIDLDPRLSGLEVALKGTAELVDENTVRLRFVEGSVDGVDPIKDCTVAKSILDEGMILIVAYPDGEQTCE